MRTSCDKSATRLRAGAGVSLLGVGHRVEGASQFAQLARHAGLLCACAEVAGAQPARGGREATQRPDDPARDRCRDEQCDNDGDRRAGEHGVAEGVAQALLLAREPAAEPQFGRADASPGFLDRHREGTGVMSGAGAAAGAARGAGHDLSAGIADDQHRVLPGGDRRGVVDARPRPRLVELTPTEWGLLRTLTRTAGRVFSRYEPINEVRGYEFEGYERTIDSHVENLRRKIETDPHDPKVILTVLGAGYRFGLTRDV